MTALMRYSRLWKAAERVRNVLPIARSFGLSAYDGAYLELAVRGAALATLDAKLEKAAQRAGVDVFSEY